MIASLEKDNGGVATPSALTQVERSSPGVATARLGPTTRLDRGIDLLSTTSPAARLGAARSARLRFGSDANSLGGFNRVGFHRYNEVPHKGKAECGGAQKITEGVPVRIVLMPLPSKTENLVLGVLIGVAGFAVGYGLVCGMGLVDNWSTFHAGIERLLG